MENKIVRVDYEPVYYDDDYYKKTGYHKIDPDYPQYTTQMFKVMQAYKLINQNKVIWILKNKTLTIHNIAYLEYENWEIIGVETSCKEIEMAKKQFGFDNANIKLTIRKKLD